MTSRDQMLSEFTSSMTFLIDAMLETLNFSARGSIVTNKPSHAVQTEKFFSFYEKVASSSEGERHVLIENLKTKVVSPVYDQYSINFLNQLVSEEGKVDDSFLKVSTEDRDSLKIRTVPDGLYFQISKVFLPVSEVYTEAVRISLKHRGENLPFPNKILLGLYCTIHHAVKDRLDRDMNSFFDENIRTLKESLDVCDEVQQKPSDQGPMGLIKNMLGNIDFNQIGDMMSKVSGDEKSSKEFSEVFGKLSDTIKSGGNPLEVMGDIIKQATMDAAEQQEAHEARQAQEAQEAQEAHAEDVEEAIEEASAVPEEASAVPEEASAVPEETVLPDSGL